ncbi:MAG: NAD(P)H-hydrate dehydratase [Ruminococcus sp.]|nr:NAD(P)H-hydrate dehydratase [Ruminococcus sp.]
MEMIDFESVCRLFPERKADSHKGHFGRLLCIAGSMRMPGAACMAVFGALRCGVGLLTTATAERNVPILASACWESMYLPLHTDTEGFITWAENESILTEAIRKADAVLVGCGLGQTQETALLVQRVIAITEGTLILDADGLNIASSCIDIIHERKAPVILTPHPGEMARLLGTDTKTVQQSRPEALQTLCRMLPQAAITLKGHHTIVGQGERMYMNPTGNPGMSRGGSGDVLAGMIASFAAQGLTPLDAVTAGVYLHGMAGDIAARRMSQAAMLPRDLIACIPEVFRSVEENR